MPSVHLTINKLTYTIACDEGQEEDIKRLGAVVKEHVDSMQSAFGQIGEGRLLLMAALLLADEAEGLKRKLASLQSENGTLGQIKKSEDDMADALESLTNRIETLAKTLEVA